MISQVEFFLEIPEWTCRLLVELEFSLLIAFLGQNSLNFQFFSGKHNINQRFMNW